MVELKKAVRGLTERYVTPNFLLRERKEYIRSINDTLKTAAAWETARRALSLEENGLADRFEEYYYESKTPDMTLEERQRLTDLISALFPGSREAYQKREQVFDEAYQL